MPSPSTRPLVIASRKSPLARIQAEWVAARLRQAHPRLVVEHVFVESEGDRFTGRLADAGGKGMFTSTVEALLLSKRADIAVHSMKDMPIRKEELTPGLSIVAVPAREEVRDVLVSRHGGASIKDLPQGALIGTASARRLAQLLKLRPDLKTCLLRGNVETRLRKATADPLAAPGAQSAQVAVQVAAEMSAGVDATLLAAAGLNRLGLGAQAACLIPVEEMLPAAGQGALAIQIRIGDTHALRSCLALNDSTAAACVHAERLVVGLLGAGCHSPVAALAVPEPVAGGWPGYRLRARVLSLDGKTCLEAVGHVEAKHLAKAARAVAQTLFSQGAKEVLQGHVIAQPIHKFGS